MANNRITWDEFKGMNRSYEVNITRVPTDIECPKCHVLCLWKRIDKVLLSNHLSINTSVSVGGWGITPFEDVICIMSV